MPFDLDVEHLNKVFKERFTLYRGEPTDAMMYRISASQDLATNVLQQHTDSWQTRAGPRGTARQNEDKYQGDVSIITNTLREEDIVTCHPGRRLRSDKLCDAARDPMLAIDMFALRSWYAAKLKAMAAMPHFHH